MDARDVLLKAASLIEEGWCKDVGRVYDKEGHVIARCAQSAIYDTSFPKQVLAHSISAVLVAVCLDVFHQAMNLFSTEIGWEIIPFWNDAPERTQAEVAETMRRAALRA